MNLLWSIDITFVIRSLVTHQRFLFFIVFFITMMMTYNLPPIVLKPDDGYFQNLHLRPHLSDVHYEGVRKDPTKTRWLRGIAAHIQVAIARAASAQQKERSEPVKFHSLYPDTVQLPVLKTNFVKDDFVRKAKRIEFKQVTLSMVIINLEKLGRLIICPFVF